MSITVHRKRTHFRNKGIVFAPEDYRNLSAVLADAFPDARYYMVPTDRQRNYLYRESHGLLRKHPPRVLVHPTLERISQAAYRWKADIVMVTDTQWQPEWKRVVDDHKFPHWSLLPPRQPSVFFQRRMGQYIQLKMGATGMIGHDISVRCLPGSDSHLRFASRFFRLLGKVASNRNLAIMKYPSGEIVESYIDKPAWLWIGHAARQWAAGDSRHFLSFSHRNEGLRPLPLNPPEA